MVHPIQCPLSIHQNHCQSVLRVDFSGAKRPKNQPLQPVLTHALVAIAMTTVGLTIPCGLGSAQIIPDDTLANERSEVTPNVPIRGSVGDRIDGGALRGVNLFHSFQEFDIEDGQRVYFSNPTGVENILSRVTGSSSSDILGTLGVDGHANLFLLNPHGIVFGANAQLDIRGSFVASAGDRFTFPDGSEFSAAHPQAAPLLTVNVPIGLQYGAGAPGSGGAGGIMSTGNLIVGQDLTLAGTTLDLQGQLGAGRSITLQADTVRIRDSATTPFIGAAGQDLLVQGNQTIDIFALNHPHSGLFSGGDLVLRSPNPVSGDAHYWSGGNFRIEHLDGHLGTLFSPSDPIIRSLGDVSFNTYLGNSLHILAGGRVNIGLIGITGADVGTAGTDFLTETITLSDGITTVAIDGSARPTLDVRAGVDPASIASPAVTGSNGFFFSGLTTLFGSPLPILENPALTAAPSSADIDIGGIALLGADAADGLVFLSNHYLPNLALTGDINVGVIVTTDNTAQAASALPVDLRNLLTAAGLLDGFTGNGGDIVLDSRRNIGLTGNNLADFGLTSSLILTSSGTGDAGDITLRAGDRVSLANESTILSDTNGSGRGGNIDIAAESFALTGGSMLLTRSQSAGRGGDITIRTTDQIELGDRNSFIATSAFGTTPDGGDGGDLIMDTRRLVIRDGAFATTSSELYSIGSAGNLRVNASESVEILRGLGLSANTNGFGPAGNLTITTPQLRIEQGSSISGGGLSASSRLPESGAGPGGNLTVNAEFIEIIGNQPGPVNSSSSLDTANRLFELTITGLQGQSLVSGLITGSRASRAGDLAVNLGGTGRLIVRDGAGIATVGGGRTGAGGNLTVTGARSIELTGLGGLASTAFGSGAAGNITVDADEIRVQDGAFITADTFAGGAAGRLTIDSDRLILQNGSQIRAGTTGSGQGGAVRVIARDTVLASGTSQNGKIPSGLTTATTSSGASGNITIDAGRIIVQDGAEISTSTSGSGSGGDLQVRSPFLILSNGARLSAATSGTGAGGNIRLQHLDTLRIIDSEISASSHMGQAGTLSGEAGSLDITANQILLDQGELTAITGTGDGGNIALHDLDLLLMRNGSLISAAALNDAMGGNITIDTAAGFVVAVPQENSDIIASAERGNGGNINITAQGILGLAFRQQPTSFSHSSASSRFGVDGTVVINAPEVDPGEGLVDLPSVPVDATDLVVQRCAGTRVAAVEAQGEFIIPGRGGLPATPQELLSQDEGWRDWRNPIGNGEQGIGNGEQGIGNREQGMGNGEQGANYSPSPHSLLPTSPSPLSEAQGWVVNADGEVRLIAHSAAGLSQATPGTCPVGSG
jgi:filamentous hemagglutinin family protein